MIRRIIAVLLFALVGVMPATAQQNRTTQNGSVVIATGNTFQTILAANPRFTLTIQNNQTSTDNCWIAFGAVNGTTITAGNATKAESILLQPGQSYTRFGVYVPSDAIQGTCASTSDTLYVDTQ